MPIFHSQMLDAEVLVCLSVGLKWRKFCLESCANTLYVSTIFPSEKLVAQVLVCQSVGLKCWKFCRCWMQRYLCACLSVMFKCWKFSLESCANKVYARTIFPSDKLVAQVLGVRINWF